MSELKIFAGGGFLGRWGDGCSGFASGLRIFWAFAAFLRDDCLLFASGLRIFGVFDAFFRMAACFLHRLWGFSGFLLLFCFL